MVGRRAIAIERLAPEGRVRLAGELWSAVGEGVVEVGTEVEITGIVGLTLRVRPLAKEASR
jgi:membrane protein implicated in regulation of membrane protease activity